MLSLIIRSNDNNNSNNHEHNNDNNNDRVPPPPPLELGWTAKGGREGKPSNPARPRALAACRCHPLPACADCFCLTSCPVVASAPPEDSFLISALGTARGLTLRARKSQSLRPPSLPLSQPRHVRKSRRLRRSSKAPALKGSVEARRSKHPRGKVRGAARHEVPYGRRRWGKP